MAHEDQNSAINLLPRIPADSRRRSSYRGCLIGGAVGDALGAPVEFMHISDIHKRFGISGIRDYVSAYGRIGAITDDTQMTLYTAEGLLRAHVRSVLRGIGGAESAVTAHAYLRWLATQGVRSPLLDANQPDGWLSTHRDLYHRRAPGNTCLSALERMQALGSVARNDSKGCGGVMRAAPAGMLMAHWLAGPDRQHAVGETFRIGCDIAAITHGHPTGYLTAGVLALLVGLVLAGQPLPIALAAACDELQRHTGHDETLRALGQAQKFAAHRPNDVHAVRDLGDGWVAEEALAIGLYCALQARDFESAMVLAVNHSGDSDSTGSIAGNLLGASLGIEAIPGRWVEPLELREVIEAVADDLATAHEWQIGLHQPSPEEEFYWDRYPGH